MKRAFLLIMTVLASLMACTSGPVRQGEVISQVASAYSNQTNTHNGVFLARSYSTASSTTKAFQDHFFGTDTSLGQVDLLSTLKQHGIDTLYVNVVNVNADGTLRASNTTPPPAVTNCSETGSLVAGCTFAWRVLKYVRIWEDAHPGSKFTVYAQANGSLRDGIKVAIDQPAVRTTLANEMRRFVDPTVAGYLGSTAVGYERQFDGVQYDLEPSDKNTPGCPDGNGIPERFDCSKYVVQKTKSVFNTAGLTTSLVSFCSSRWKSLVALDATGYWSDSMFYYMGLYADEIVVMNYDYGLSQTSSDYATKTHDSIIGVAKAITGESWNWDNNHPMPSKLPSIRFAMPAFENNSVHDRTVENIYTAGNGQSSALVDLQDSLHPGHLGLPAFKGGAIFSFIDGAWCKADGTPSTVAGECAPYTDGANGSTAIRFGAPDSTAYTYPDNWTYWDYAWYYGIQGW